MRFDAKVRLESASGALTLCTGQGGLGLVAAAGDKGAVVASAREGHVGLLRETTGWENGFYARAADRGQGGVTGSAGVTRGIGSTQGEGWWRGTIMQVGMQRVGAGGFDA